MKRATSAGRRRKWAWVLLAAGSVLALAAGIVDRPPGPASNPPRYASQPRPGTRLWALHARSEARFGQGTTGVLALDSGNEALDWVLASFDLAEHSIDAQYFKWDDDIVGLLVTERLLAAADRGVEVRVLLDDAGLRGADRRLATLGLHPNVDVRVFNPWGSRESSSARSLEWLLNRKQLNRRMHNKLLVADNTVALTGGRNIAGRFFGLGDSFNVVDLDLLLVGPVARDVSSAFDAFWNDGSAHAAVAPDPGVTLEDLDEFRAYVDRTLDDRSGDLAGFPRARREWGELLLAAVENMASGPARVVWDTPVAGGPARASRVIDSVKRFADDVRSELIVSSAFVVPDDETIAWLGRLTDRGVRVRILTNSLASNIGTIAHSGYKKYRKKLLAAGVELHELRDDAEVRAEWRVAPTSAERLALHAKAIVVDRRKVFVGSLNLDRRSISLNTEMGVLVESPELAEEVAVFVVRHMAPENAWRVFLDDRDRLVWQNSDRSVTRQPARGRTQRVKDWLYGLLPIKRHL